LETTKGEVVRRYAKYLFLDAVQFSKRSAEAQSDIVSQLNLIVRQALEIHEVREDDCILIPTGDGMCITLLSPDLPYDIHIKMALSILASLDAYNKINTNESRQFDVRIGINQNTDILVTDINARRNIAGAGINMASRIMDKAEGRQILVSQTVFDELQPSEQYMGKFQHFDAAGKHGLKFRVYQYIGDNHLGLSRDKPNEFVKMQAPELKLSKTIAYYFATAIKNKQFIVNKQGYGQDNYSLIVILWFLAKDSEGQSEATDISPYDPIIYGDGNLSLNEVFDYYSSIDFQVISSLANYIQSHLVKYINHLFTGGKGSELLFVNGMGKQKLKNEWPSIWQEFDLDKFAE
jgi:class 3 adenylate cyclase